MQDETTVEEPKKTARQLKAELRERNTRERDEKTKATKLMYQAVKDNPAFVHLIQQVKSFAEYHSKIAKDAIGYKDVADDEGNITQRAITLSNEERLSHLDKAAGQDEILAMIDRYLA